MLRYKIWLPHCTAAPSHMAWLWPVAWTFRFGLLGLFGHYWSQKGSWTYLYIDKLHPITCFTNSIHTVLKNTLHNHTHKPYLFSCHHVCFLCSSIVPPCQNRQKQSTTVIQNHSKTHLRHLLTQVISKKMFTHAYAMQGFAYATLPYDQPLT